jgi:plastocyanin
MTSGRKRDAAMSSAAAAVVVVTLALAVTSVVYVNSAQGGQDQLSSQNQQISSLSSEIFHLLAASSTSSTVNSIPLPVMDQTPTIRTVRETWYLSPSAHQDRFDPSFVIVNQGDTVRLTLIDNDTVAHDFVIGPPYSIIVNATVPGLINDLTGVTFTTNSTNDSPGVVIKGTPGSVSAFYSFQANYSGIFEFVCTYHAAVGMIGYLVVLPNAAYTSTVSASTSSIFTTASASPKTALVSIVAGAGTNTSNLGFTPNNITVVFGVNNTVEWTNDDSQSHTVTANDGTFDSGNLAPGATYTYTFPSPGVYTYHCFYHPWMTGTVTVLVAP